VVDNDEEEDVEPVVPFGDTEVTMPTTTLLSVYIRCARIVALLSTIESLKCTIPNQQMIMRIILHLLRLVTTTITYQNNNKEKEEEEEEEEKAMDGYESNGNQETDDIQNITSSPSS
jgi:hypothetical protein